MQTIIHVYQFNISVPAQARDYEQLRVNLHAMGLECFASLGGFDKEGMEYREKIVRLDGQPLTLETEFLFTNQWNTAPTNGAQNGLRVFDWAETIYDNNRDLKTGHWLEQTEEMREVRKNTLKCGYCGKQEPAGSYAFCPHCIDSEYLTVSALPLTRMVAVKDRDKERAPLTEAESASLLPLYKQAQTVGTTERGKARLAKFRADIEAKAKREINNAQTERDGFIWMLDAGLSTALVSNCIYYNHTQRFSFGWRKPVEAELLSAILEVISEFRFPYEIKCADGRTLTGN